jgi:hypothetical protein
MNTIQDRSFSEMQPVCGQALEEQPTPTTTCCGWLWTVLPSPSYIIWSVGEFFRTLGAIYRSAAVGNYEGVLEGRVQLAGIPLALLYSITTVIALIYDYGYFIHNSISEAFAPLARILALPTMIFGLSLCAVVGIYESYCLKRAIQILTTKGTALERLAQITAGDNREAKIDDLQKRLGHRCTQEIVKDLDRILETKNEQAAAALLETIDIQAKKRLIVHIVGLAALALCAIGFILSMVACPAMIPFVLILVSGILTTATYFYGLGTLDEKGWTFDWKKACPLFAWIYNKICGAEEAPKIEKAPQIEMSPLSNS